MKPVKPITGESEPEVDPWEVALAEATSVEEVEMLRRRAEAAKRLSTAFGSLRLRRNRLVAWLKRLRRYRGPVKGGTGTQMRTRRRKFS